jgi:hypothetical protein
MSNVSDFRTFGEVDIAFSRNLQLAWTTWGGHCNLPVAFFNAAPGEGGFFPLGTYGIRGETDPGNPDSSSTSAMMIRPSAQANPDRPPLMPPVGFNEIWNDSGSGCDMDGTCSVPVAPSGYTALGVYFADGHEVVPAANDPNVMVCVRNDLISEVPAGENFWNDSGSHHNGDISTWFPAARNEPEESKMCVTAGTFIANTSYDSPGGPTFALCLPVRSVSPSAQPQVPAMSSRTAAPADPPLQVDHEVEVPFTGIKDPGKPVSWQIENSPFYILKREIGYTCIEFFNNNTEKEATGQWEFASGVTEEETSQFESKVGVEISAKTGVNILGNKVELSASVTTEFGWTKGTAHTAMNSETSSFTYQIPAQHACTLWKLNYTFLVTRADGSNVPGRLEFVTSSRSAAIEQFPPPAASEVQAKVIEREKGGEEVPLAQSAA